MRFPRIPAPSVPNRPFPSRLRQALRTELRGSRSGVRAAALTTDLPFAVSLEGQTSKFAEAQKRKVPLAEKTWDKDTRTGTSPWRGDDKYMEMMRACRLSVESAKPAVGLINPCK